MENEIVIIKHIELGKKGSGKYEKVFIGMAERCHSEYPDAMKFKNFSSAEKLYNKLIKENPYTKFSVVFNYGMDNEEILAFHLAIPSPYYNYVLIQDTIKPWTKIVNGKPEPMKHYIKLPFDYTEQQARAWLLSQPTVFKKGEKILSYHHNPKDVAPPIQFNSLSD